MTKKITMAEISAQLGISKMTVSRYFNGGYVSDKNRQRIDEIVTEHQYVPNKFARSIRAQSNIIGFVAPRIESYTTSQVIKGALAAAKAHQTSMLFHATGFEHESECQAVREFHGLNALGTILIPSKLSLQEPLYQKIDNLVFIGKDMPNQCSLVYPEQQAITELYQSCIEKLNQSQQTICQISYIYDARMLSFRTELFKTLADTTPSIPYQGIQLDNSEDTENYQSISLQKNQLYFCATDNIAIRLYRLAKQQGLTIGQDLWVVGIGDYEFSDLLVPSLTSLSFNYYQMGFQAVKKILTNDFTTIHGTYQLKIRESSQFK